MNLWNPVSRRGSFVWWRPNSEGFVHTPSIKKSGELYDTGRNRHSDWRLNRRCGNPGWGRVMATARKYRKPNKSIQPTCPQCSEPMKLARVAPFKGYADIQDRTYECAKCGHSESWIASQHVPKAKGGGQSTHH